MNKAVRISDSHDLSSYMKGYKDYEYEIFFILTLDKNKNLIQVHKTMGGPSSVELDHDKNFEIIEKDNASYCIMMHNHPQGHLAPSYNDNDLTNFYDHFLSKKGITLLDHLVFAKEGYFSYHNSETLQKYRKLEFLEDTSVALETAHTYYTRMVPEY
jgi:DNA repair protein RadC